MAMATASMNGDNTMNGNGTYNNLNGGGSVGHNSNLEQRKKTGDHNNDKEAAAATAADVAVSTEHFCNWLVDEIEINRKGRFLTWDSALNSWVQMTDKLKIRRKISVALYNYEKRHNARLW